MLKNNQSPNQKLPIQAQIIERHIYLIRGQKVMLDSDLAELYEVLSKALIQAVKRNKDRFPEDFMFQLNNQEAALMRSQTVTAPKRNFRYLPYAFTEQGIAMLASVLKSKKAVQVNIAIMRTFVHIRKILVGNEELSKKLSELEKITDKHNNQIAVIFEAIKKLITATIPKSSTSKSAHIGFRTEDKI